MSSAFGLPVLECSSAGKMFHVSMAVPEHSMALARPCRRSLNISCPLFCHWSKSMPPHLLTDSVLLFAQFCSGTNLAAQVTPTFVPTLHPTMVPSIVPSRHPTLTPTFHPSVTPTRAPTEVPTELGETYSPTVAPTSTEHPTLTPSTDPSTFPTLTPSKVPTSFPTLTPTTQGPTYLCPPTKVSM